MQTVSRSGKSSKTPNKACSKCAVKKPATTEHFGPDARGLYGLRGDCRACRRKSDLEHKRVRAQRGVSPRLSRFLKKFKIPDEHAAVLSKGSGLYPSPAPLCSDDAILNAYATYDRPQFGVSNHTARSQFAKALAGAPTTEESFDPNQEVRLLPLGQDVERVLIIPDCHHPYSDKRAWQLLMQAAREFKPDIIVILGDFADFYSVSAHSKNPNRARNLEAEVEAVNEALDELDELGAARKLFVTGNHEDRLERYLMDRAPELFNMVRIRDLFRLSERGWLYVPYKRHAKIGHLHVTHDTNRAGRYAHYQSQADFGGANVVVGHTHRLGYMVEGCAQGKPHVSAMLGWLGDFDTVDYMHQVRARRDWSHGFGLGYLQPDGCVHLTPVPIINNTVVVEGKTIRLDWKA